MKTTSKENTKLLNAIDDIVSSSNNSVEALNKILEFRKNNEGLKGSNYFFDPTIDDIPSEEAANKIIKLIRTEALGNVSFTELNNVVL